MNQATCEKVLEWPVSAATAPVDGPAAGACLGARLSREAGRVWARRTMVLLAVATAFRLLSIATTQVADGEAYYAMWARAMDWSYYDHPPLVAWMTWFFTRFSGSSFAIRLGPVLCATVFNLLLYRLATRLFSPRAGFFAVLLVNLIPTFIVTGFVLNPEAPLAPLWVTALLLLEGMREHDEPWRPIATGAVVGLAFLAKFTGVLMVPVTVLYLAASPVCRRWLWRPSFYLGGVVALLVASPVIIWNLQHDWASLTLHFVERVAPRDLGTFFHNVWGVAWGQVTANQPLIFPLLLAALAMSVRRANSDERFRFLAFTSGPVLLFFLYTMARVKDPEAHWTMVGFIPLAVAAGGWVDEYLRPGKLATAFQWYARLTVGLTAVALALGYLHSQSGVLLRLVPPAMYDGRPDVVNEMIGWDEARPAIQQALAELGPEAVVAGSQFALCAQILRQLDDAPNVYCPTPRRTQFDFMGRHTPPEAAPVLFVNSDHYNDEPGALLPDRACTSVKTVNIERAGRVVRSYQLFGCRPAQVREPLVLLGLPLGPAGN